MGLLNGLEMQPERQTPAQLPTAIQQASGDCCPDCQMAMPRRHRYARNITCGECRRIAGGMTLRGDDTRYQGFSKKTARALALAAQGLSCARADQWVGGVKSAIGRWWWRTPLPEPELLSGAALEPDGLWSGRAQGVGN